MYAQVEKSKENTLPTGRQESMAVANSVAQKRSDVHQGLAFSNNRQEMKMQKKSIKADAITQLMSVAQLATRKSSPVRFNGSVYALEQLIRQWGPPRGTSVVATQTDFVGGMYTVRFTNTGGPAISKVTADGWVQAGIAHADNSDSGSD